MITIYKVLIIDDEKWIRRGIKVVLDKEKLKIDEMFEASNTIEAEEILKKNAIEIIISDVKMPGEDGCSFCERMIKLYPHIKIIMVSGYNEFQFVKNAISYGAMDYLLKPINREELNKVMGKVIKKIESETVLNHLSSNIYFTIESMFKQYISQGDVELEEKLGQLIQFHLGDYIDFFMLGIEFDNNNQTENDVKEILYNNLYDGFKENLHIIIISSSKKRLVMIVLRRNDFYDSARVMKRTQDEFEINNIDHIISLSKRYEKFKDLPMAYIRINQMLDNRMINDVIEESSKQPNLSLPPQYFKIGKEIVSAVDVENRELFLTLIEELSEEFHKDTTISMRVVKMLLVSLVYDFMKILANEPRKEQGLLDQLLTESNNILNIYSAEDGLKIVLELGNDIITSKELENKSDIHQAVKQIVNQIEENYQEDITLNYLADKYYVNSTYLSAMFKEITGDTFMSYLTQVRMREAKRLLENYNMKIKDIAYGVGYKNEKYFFRVFKKYVKMSPSEYRKLRKK